MCWKFNCTEDQLCQVDVQAEVAHVQTQPIIHQTCSKPVSRAEEVSSQESNEDFDADVEYPPGKAHDEGTDSQRPYPEDVQHVSSFFGFTLGLQLKNKRFIYFGL